MVMMPATAEWFDNASRQQSSAGEQDHQNELTLHRQVSSAVLGRHTSDVGRIRRVIPGGSLKMTRCLTSKREDGKLLRQLLGIGLARKPLC
jgi:hypothetical protein